MIVPSAAAPGKWPGKWYDDDDDDDIVESLGPMNIAAYSFLAEMGRNISDVSGDDRESSYLFQRISVLIQRYNAILLHKSFTEESRPDQWPLQC